MRRMALLGAVAALALAAPARADSVDDAIQQLQQIVDQQQASQTPSAPPVQREDTGGVSCPELDRHGDCKPHGRGTSLPAYLSVRTAKAEIRKLYLHDLNGMALHTRTGACSRRTATRIVCALHLRVKGSACRAPGLVVLKRGDYTVTVGSFRCRAMRR